MERLTEKYWGNLDPWECCGQDYYCKRGCHDEGRCTKGCIVPQIYVRLAKYEDTGLTPEEVVAMKIVLMGRELAKITDFDGVSITRMCELAQAEKDGRIIIAQPNDPLTLEELREMTEPVWIEWCDSNSRDENEWAIVMQEGGCRTFKGFAALFEWYGHAWLAYRRKPEEGMK